MLSNKSFLIEVVEILHEFMRIILHPNRISQFLLRESPIFKSL